MTGAETPFSADFEINVTETAQLEWNRTVNATFARDGDGDGDGDVDSAGDIAKFLSVLQRALEDRGSLSLFFLRKLTY